MGVSLKSETETIEPSTASILVAISGCVPVVWTFVVTCFVSPHAISSRHATSRGKNVLLEKKWGTILKGYPFRVLATTLAGYEMDIFFFSNIT